MEVNSVMRKLPFVRLLLFFIVAVLLAFRFYNFLFEHLKIIYLTTGLLTIAAIVLIVSNRVLKLADFLIPATVFSISVTLCLVTIPNPERFKIEGQYTGVVIEKPQLKTNSTLIKVKLKRYNEQKINTAILLSTQRDTAFCNKILPGDYISFYGKPERIRNYNNPGEFDFALLMAIRGVWYRIYLNPNEIGYFKNDIRGFNLKGLAMNIRDFVIRTTGKYIDSPAELAVIRALTVGVRDEIPEDLNQSYINTGVVHVLSISGLHVGIIYMILNFLLGLVGRNKHFSVIKTVVIILAIWLYALLSGFSPPVIRASVMFSILSLGKILNREISIFNILAASALFILCFNPLLVYDIGFQLSYLAIAGIIYFQPIFYSFFQFKNSVAEYFFSLVTVSLAAQFATAPLTIYYFHQFPSYFLLSNLVIIPLSFVILCGSILLLTLSFFATPASLVAWFLEKTTWLTNQYITAIDNIPGGLISQLNITHAQLIYLYIIMLGIIVWYSLKKSLMAFPILILLVMFCAIPVWLELKNYKKEIVCIYNVPKKLCAGFYLKTGNYLFVRDASEKDLKYFRRISQSHQNMAGIKGQTYILPFDSLAAKFSDEKSEVLPSENNLIRLNNKQEIAFISKQPEMAEWPKISKANWVVISGKVSPPENFTYKGLVVFSPEMDYRAGIEWKKLTEQKCINFHTIKNQGAITLEITP